MPREKDLRAFHPPLHWQPGEIVRWDFDVNANPDIRPGEYKAHAEGGDWLILDRVRLR